jgi:glycosyltransferase involved in cell wall biosynthesis
MYESLPEIPGVALMLDASLSTLVDWLESSGRHPVIFLRELLSVHGEKARLDVEAAKRGDLPFEVLVDRYPLSHNVPLHAHGLIFESRYARDLLARAYPDLREVPNCVVPPASFGDVDPEERRAARLALGLPAGDLLIGSFGILDETRRNHVLLAALAQGALVQDRRIRIAFVGELPQIPYRMRMETLLDRHPMRDRIEITGPVDAAAYARYRAACDIAVDLTSVSRGASPAPKHGLLAAGCPAIVGDDAEMRELPDDAVWKVNSSDVEAVADALSNLVANPAARERLGASGRRWVKTLCHPARIAEQHAAAVALLPALDRARCAAALIRRVAACVADERLEDEVTLAASDAVACGLALHPASGRRLAERR